MIEAQVGRRDSRHGRVESAHHTSYLRPHANVSRQLQAVDCDIDGRIEMEEIALVRAQRGARCPNYLGIPIEVDNQASLHSSFYQLTITKYY
jgi:hypothetical protein